MKEEMKLEIEDKGERKWKTRWERSGGGDGGRIGIEDKGKVKWR